MIFSTERAKKSGQILLCTKDSIMRVKNTDMDCISGKMAQDMKETGTRTELKAQENTNGKMADAIMVNGKIITCTEKVFTPGLMEGDMRANMKWIKNMASEFINGQMAVFTKVIGITVSSTDRVNTFFKMEP